MIDQYFLSVEVFAHPRGGHVFGPLRGGERPLWQGCAGLAEYAFDEPASQPRWTLPETTELMVTDQRVLYAHTRADSPDTREMISGELRWTSPQHLRVQPGAAQAGRSAATTQIQLVCAGPEGTWPALVFAGGDLKSVAEADRLANLIRQAIARFRLDNAAKLGLSTQQSRVLSRLVIGPEFANYQGGPGQTVSILGSLPVNSPAATPAPETTPKTTPEVMPASAPEPVAPAWKSRVRKGKAAHRAPDPSEAPTVDLKVFRKTTRNQPADDDRSGNRPAAGDQGRGRRVNKGPVGEGPTRVITARPGMAADLARAQRAAEAEATTHQEEPELASRAAEIAAQIADLVSRPDPAPGAVPRHAEPPPARFEETTNLADRAESLRRMAARLAANSGRHKATGARQGTPARKSGLPS